MTKASLAAGAALALTASVFAGGAARATTGPAPHVLVRVKLTDSRITLSKYRVADVTYVDFYLHNAGRRTHNFVIGTQRSMTLRPGERLHFFVSFPVFGFYRFRSTVHARPAMRGRFDVESPQPPD